ncbi:MAG TPA: hypothetical protein DCY13_11670 [Verrucomicrobiales bacterium]|nr:hypothetical protein [Verrucomicrobiales bacterium]
MAAVAGRLPGSDHRALCHRPRTRRRSVELAASQRQAGRRGVRVAGGGRQRGDEARQSDADRRILAGSNLRHPAARAGHRRLALQPGSRQAGRTVFQVGHSRFSGPVQWHRIPQPAPPPCSRSHACSLQPAEYAAGSWQTSHVVVDIDDYLIDQTGLDWQALLEEWRFLLPPQFRIWLLTRTGDLFIAVPDGSIHMLDVGAGKLDQIARSRDEFCTKIDEPGVADDWLMIPIVDQLVASGVVLGSGHCYSFRQLPALGGAYTADNRMVFPICEHFGGWGSVHRQMAGFPDGSPVTIKPAD